jgi:hypothetical protein
LKKHQLLRKQQKMNLMQSFNYKQLSLAAIAFLAAWQATDFALDYRAVLGAVVAASMGAMNPNAKTKTK